MDKCVVAVGQILRSGYIQDDDTDGNVHGRSTTTSTPSTRDTTTTTLKSYSDYESQKKTLAGLAGACDLLRPWTRCPRDLVLLIGPFTQEYPRLLWPHLRPTLHIHEAVRWLGPMLLGSGQRRLRAGPFPFCSPCWHRLARRSPRGASFFFLSANPAWFFDYPGAVCTLYSKCQKVVNVKFQREILEAGETTRTSSSRDERHALQSPAVHCKSTPGKLKTMQNIALFGVTSRGQAQRRRRLHRSSLLTIHNIDVADCIDLQQIISL